MGSGMPGVRGALDRLLASMAERAAGSWMREGERADEVQRAALSFEDVERLPVIFSFPYPENVRFQPLAGSQIYRSFEAMLYNELVYAWGSSPLLSSSIGDDLGISVRPNWGTVVVASVIAEAVARRRGFVPGEDVAGSGGGFGAGFEKGFARGAVPALVEQRGDDTPWIIRNEECPVRLEELAGLALSDGEVARSGWMPRILDTFAAFRALLEPWPELATAIRMTLPDLQGPLDTAEQLMGADLFMEMMDRPGLARDALVSVARIQADCAAILRPLTRDFAGEGTTAGGSTGGGLMGGSSTGVPPAVGTPAARPLTAASGATPAIPGTRSSTPAKGAPGGDFTHQHGFLVRGGILVRCDSAVMICSELYRDVVAEADEVVLAASGGGGLHSCGRVAHVVQAMLELPSIQCFDFGQSELNPMDELYALAREKRIPFLRVLAAPEELMSGSILKRFPTGVSLRCPVGSLDEARQVFRQYTSIRKKA